MSWALSDTATRPDRLLAATMRFAHAPAGDIHPEMVRHLEPSLADHDDIAAKLIGCPRLQQRLSRRWLHRAALQDVSQIDFSTGLRWLALCDSRTLIQLCRYAGAVWHAETIRHLILSEEMAAIRAELGEACHDFALHQHDLAPIVPIVPRFAQLLDAIAEDGVRCLLYEFADAPLAVFERLLWKLPPQTDFVREVPDDVEEIAHRILLAVVEELFTDDRKL